ncbi:hypothetical protein J4216_06945 [Candidatus Woesearchaeota archaeon]|nr:hypothetical protein [Candidatus Woesearchaeota archaeon]
MINLRDFSSDEQSCAFDDHLDKNTKIVRDGWSPKAVVILDKYPISTPHIIQSTLEVVTLKVVYTNDKDEGKLERLGKYISPLIREEIDKPFGNNWASNFGQNQIGRALDYLLVGTNIIASNVHDFPHKVKLRIKKPFWDLFSSDNYFEAYQTGVRHLSIGLMHIDTAIGEVYRWMNKYPNDEYFQREGEQRLRQLRSHMQDFSSDFSIFRL